MGLPGSNYTIAHHTLWRKFRSHRITLNYESVKYTSNEKNTDTQPCWHQWQQRNFMHQNKTALYNWYTSACNLRWNRDEVSCPAICHIDDSVLVINQKHRLLDLTDALFLYGVLCQKQVSRAETSNHIPQILWDVITCLWSWYLLRAQPST